MDKISYIQILKEVEFVRCLNMSIPKAYGTYKKRGENIYRTSAYGMVKEALKLMTMETSLFQ